MKEQELIRSKAGIFYPSLVLISGIIFSLICMPINVPLETLEESGSMYLIWIPTLIIFILLGLLIMIMFANDPIIVVTNKRVFGKTIFGRQVDLPLDSISAVGYFSYFKELRISTSSGIIKFAFLKNSEQVYNIVSQLLSQRQNSNAYYRQNVVPNMNNYSANLAPNINQNNNSINNQLANDELDKLRSLKKLMDEGVITKKEFEEKKKKILDL